MLLARGMNRPYIKHLFLMGVLDASIGQGSAPKMINNMPTNVTGFMCFVSALSQAPFGLESA